MISNDSYAAYRAAAEGVQPLSEDPRFLQSTEVPKHHSTGVYPLVEALLKRATGATQTLIARGRSIHAARCSNQFHSLSKDVLRNVNSCGVQSTYW